MEHVGHTDPVLESFDERMIRDKEVAHLDAGLNGIDLHGRAG